MARKSRDYSHSCMAKSWNPVFLTNRKLTAEETRGELGRRLSAAHDELRFFLQESESPVPSPPVEEIEEFCKKFQSGNLETELAGLAQTIWLDDRSINDPTRECRPQSKLLNATELGQELEKPRFGYADIPDVDRRLIHSNTLDPPLIRVLAETAADHQAPALKDAIWRHITRQQSIRVKIPYNSYPRFELAFHLPFYTLRPSPTPNASTGRVNTGALNQWTGLPFLDIQLPGPENAKSCGIYEAQVSVLLCGLSTACWIAYGFVDTACDEEDPEPEFPPLENLKVDPIVSSSVNPVGADVTVWDPREYFLKALEVWVTRVHVEFEWLVQKVKQSIERYRDQHFGDFSQQHGTTVESAEIHKGNHAWNWQTQKLLSQLLNYHARIIKVWDRFSSPNGDIGYFDDIAESSPHIRNLLATIREKFEELEDHQDTLISLKKSCEEDAKLLGRRLTLEEHRLNLEGNKATQHNVTTSELLLLFVSPFALVTAYFSMDKAVIPFTPTKRSFFIAHFIIMFVVYLAFIVLRASPQWPCGWTRVSTWVKAKQPDASAHFQSMHAGVGTLNSTNLATHGDIDNTSLSALEGVTIGQGS